MCESGMDTEKSGGSPDCFNEEEAEIAGFDEQGTSYRCAAALGLGWLQAIPDCTETPNPQSGLLILQRENTAVTKEKGSSICFAIGCLKANKDFVFIGFFDGKGLQGESTSSCCASAIQMSLQFVRLKFAQTTLSKEMLHKERGLGTLGGTG